MAEVRLGMALILKRFKKELNRNDIYEKSKNVYNFAKSFEFNFENIFQFIE